MKKIDFDFDEKTFLYFMCIYNFKCVDMKQTPQVQYCRLKSAIARNDLGCKINMLKCL